MTEPHVGDYVGAHNETGVDLYICAVDRGKQLVQIGQIGAGGTPWLNATQARAFYGYEWGAHKPIPWMVAAFRAMGLRIKDPE